MTKMDAVKIAVYLLVIAASFDLHEQWMAVTQAALGGLVLGQKLTLIMVEK